MTSPAGSQEPIRVLIADDEPALRRSVARMLLTRGMKVATAEDGVKALDMLRTEPFDVALVDLMMPRLGGLELLQQVRLHHQDVEVVMMMAYGDVETAVKAVQAGAYNFLTKPFRSNEEVGLIIGQAAERRNLRARAEQLERSLATKASGLGGLIGTSPIMRAIYQNAKDVAVTSVTVLILGESGTGKELTARAIHEHSPRKDKPFVAVNCSAIPEGIVESELFGHVKGAFTNATSQRAGLFEAANHGTIFLDEVGDLPQQAQVKLLRVLQEGEIKRVGSNENRQVDVRVVAATNLDLRKKIDAGKFREDLFYRLNVVALTLPALRDRREDIPLLAYHFLKKHTARDGNDIQRISAEAMELLCAQRWPGNVRELENAIERALVFCKDSVLPENLGLGPEQPPTRSTTLAPGGPEENGASALSVPGGLVDLPYREAKGQMQTVFDHFYFTALKERTDGNVSEAARQAGLDRSNFRRAVRRAGVTWRERDSTLESE